MILSPENDNISLDLDKCVAPMDLRELFLRPAPVHIEIGSGKGTFLLNHSRAHPELNFLGIEWANKYYRYSVDRMRRWQMTNVRILRADARDFIGRYVADGAVAVFHVYFPDPWPKKRHQKRRFFTVPNITEVWRCLQTGGELHTVTDHADYYNVIREVLLDIPQTAKLFEQIDFFPADTADAGEWVGSNFERKYLRQKRQFYHLALKKKSANKLCNTEQFSDGPGL